MRKEKYSCSHTSSFRDLFLVIKHLFTVCDSDEHYSINATVTLLYTVNQKKTVPTYQWP